MENLIYLNEEEIAGYLRNFGAGRDSHDTELSEAVRLRRFFDKQLGRTHLIAIPLDEDGFQQLRAGKISKNEALRNHRKQATEVDFIIMDEEDHKATHRDSVRGHIVQMKRLTDRQFDGDLTSSIIGVIKKAIDKGYEKSGYLSLYIAVNLAPKSHVGDWQKITDFINKEKRNPFVQVMVGPFKDGNGEEYLVEVFPRLIFPRT